MILSMVLAGAAFTFSTEKDRFDDKETYVASIENSGGVSLNVACGAATDRELIVIVSADRPLMLPLHWRLSNTHTTRVRFDERPTMEMTFRYSGWQAVTESGNAHDFASNLKTSSVASVELTDRSGVKFYINFPTTNAAESIDQVYKKCFAPH